MSVVFILINLIFSFSFFVLSMNPSTSHSSKKLHPFGHVKTSNAIDLAAKFDISKLMDGKHFEFSHYEIDWRQRKRDVVHPIVHDQGDCKNCFAFATAEVYY